MNLVATSTLGLLFNLLFMTPIQAHSPHFRKLWNTVHSKAYLFIEWLSYLSGVNAMRLLTSGFMGVKAYQANKDLSSQKFYMLPLNMTSNYTLIFTVFQWHWTSLWSFS
jgi:hypothetical protein